MNLEIYLNNGMKFTAKNVTSFNGEEYKDMLNNPQVQFISVGDLVLNCSAIMMIVPVDVTAQ